MKKKLRWYGIMSLIFSHTHAYIFKCCRAISIIIRWLVEFVFFLATERHVASTWTYFFFLSSTRRSSYFFCVCAYFIHHFLFFALWALHVNMKRFFFKKKLFLHKIIFPSDIQVSSPRFFLFFISLLLEKKRKETKNMKCSLVLHFCRVISFIGIFEKRWWGRRQTVVKWLRSRNSTKVESLHKKHIQSTLFGGFSMVVGAAFPLSHV